MADLPFPITGTAKQQTELMMRLWEEMFEERVGGGYVGDVFEIDSDDVLSINISGTGGLTKSGNELAILNHPTGGLSSTADGERVKLKTGGGLSTDADGLYVADAYYSFGNVDCPAGTDPKAALPADTLTLANGAGISITGNSTTNTVTIAATLATLYDANTILKADSDNTPEALVVGEQTVVGRATGGEITALSIDSDLSSVSSADDTIPSAKATKAYADLMVPLATFNANTILKADADNTPEALTVAEQTLVGRITGGEITALSASQVRTLLDVPTNAEAVLDTLYNANTILKADEDNTPEALTVGEQTIVGRATGGDIAALSASQVRAIIDSPSNAEAVLDTLFDANTILKADADNTPEALTVAEQTLVGRITGGEITALTKAQVLGLLDLDDVLETKRITTPAATNLTIDPTGDLVLDPAGNDILPGTGYDLTLGSLTKKFLAFHAAELFVETLVAQDTMATIGGRIIVAPTTMLTSDVAAGDTTIYCKHNSLASGDIVYLESGGNVEFVSIDSAPGGAGPYSYSVTRNLDGTGANTWSAGDAVLNTGATGDGFIDLYSVAGMIAGSTAGPTIVGNVRTGAIYTDIEPRWAIGNLNGLYGYATDIYGAAFGSPDAAWLKIDPTNGVRIGHNATTSIQLDASGNVTVAGDITATSGYFQTVTLGKTGTASGTLVLQLNDGGGDTYVAYGKTDFTNTDAGFILGIDDSDGNKGKVYIGDSGTYLNWDGAGLAIKGSITLTGGSGWANLTDAPTDLADINATEGSKLSGIATGADVTLSAINGGLTVTGGGITLSSGGAIKGGQTDYATGTGFFLGYSGSAYKFSIGSSTKYITWDGSTLAVGGDIIATGNIAANAATQVYAAFTATQVEFASANEVTVQTTSSVNIPAAATGAVVVVSASVEFDKITSFGNVCTVTVKIKRASTVLGTYYVTLTTPNVGTMFNATLTDTPGSKGDYDYTITCDPDVYYKNWGYANRSLICTVHKK
ncbi:MAG: hypothetical protein BWY01_01727 [Synergistetes bacterium ADurb.Bin155]|nr:MAG: hypothetical protein BWY01_01727 [Synergistetes bacterium ADurb.Bin155]